MGKNVFMDDRPDRATIRKAAREGVEDRGFGAPHEVPENVARARMTIDGPKEIIEEYKRLCKRKRYAQWEGLLAFIEKETGRVLDISEDRP
tara:strand:- start:213 stop:485 length:273 start_codon:yes stop_codon:yes gene_type:complete